MGQIIVLESVFDDGFTWIVIGLESKAERKRTFSWEKENWGMDLRNIYKHLKGRCKEDDARLFSAVISARMRGNVHKLKTGVLSGRTALLCRWLSTGKVAQRNCGVSILRDVQKVSGRGPEQHVLGGCAWATESVLVGQEDSSNFNHHMILQWLVRSALDRF